MDPPIQAVGLEAGLKAGYPLITDGIEVAFDAHERSCAQVCSGKGDVSGAAHPLSSVALERATEDTIDQQDSGRARLAHVLQSVWSRRAGAHRSAAVASAPIVPYRSWC